MKETTPLFLDTEFTGLHQDCSLISLALVLDEHTYFYAELTDYEVSQTHEWLRENVINNLLFSSKASFIEKTGKVLYMKGNQAEVKVALIEWFKHQPKVEIWADVLAYDWVLFCNLFENAFNLPPNIYYIPFDMATVLKSKGINPDISRIELAFSDSQDVQTVIRRYNIETQTKHNALFDAIVLRETYRKIFTLE
jgi:3' exoribonuclease, RNase T-like